MKTLTLTCLFFSLLAASKAQVTFIVDSLPAYTPPGDIIYIAGDFQGWNPGDPAYSLQKNAEDKWSIQLEAMTEGTVIQFKFTRGDWGKVEKGIMGEEIPNRQFNFGNGDTVGIVIYNWADNSGGNSTAAENVLTVDSVYMPQLDRFRRIWIYLPPDYESSDKHYPVIYMHDGQNLFDTYTSFAGEWQVDETLNDLFDMGYQVPIVVGIDNGGTERINEYTPWSNPQYGGGQGANYMQFIVETLKPLIDDTLRTLTGRESTAIWGSSLGGLISFYGALKYQDVFGKAGIYSPSYWFSDSVWLFTEQMGHQEEMRLYQMAGSLEGGTMVEDIWAMNDTLTVLGFGEEELSTTIINGGQHNEASWASDFAEAYLWLFHSYANDISELPAAKQLFISPNPVSDYIHISVTDPISYGKLAVYDMQGCRMLKSDYTGGDSIRISGLSAGLYILEIALSDVLYRGKFVKR
jgi:predicted alpha/beta superfamily hydrolase